LLTLLYKNQLILESKYQGQGKERVRKSNNQLSATSPKYNPEYPLKVDTSKQTTKLASNKTRGKPAENKYLLQRQGSSTTRDHEKSTCKKCINSTTDIFHILLSISLTQA
jgi:hypothetical protein